MCWFVLVGTVLLVCLGVDTSHFRGGTISWKPTDIEYEVFLQRSLTQKQQYQFFMKTLFMIRKYYQTE